MARKKRIPKHESVWRSVRRKAPRVPDITCPAIDDVIQRLDALSNTTKRLTTAQNKTLTNKLEKLRQANEQLRDSGVYWHDACKSVIEKHIRKKTNKW
jgi:ribosomal protein S3AE